MSDFTLAVSTYSSAMRAPKRRRGSNVKMPGLDTAPINFKGIALRHELLTIHAEDADIFM